ncbi:MAG: hypothetical protein BWY45_01972 [Euryarchaeota archaeon ADurb.Bin294]|jgi:hypothetical protein|nr:MAG: hypothetical protein BWY45_01972 [Euryarchaeota archaeon ADurb.Bin294]
MITMNIIKVLRREAISEDYLSADYLLSGQITLEGLDILSNGAYTITGCQYLSPCYHIQKGDNIQISGIIQSSVIRVTYPAYSSGYIEEYLSSLIYLIPELKQTNSFLQTLCDDVKMILRSKFHRNIAVNSEIERVSLLIID